MAPETLCSGWLCDHAAFVIAECGILEGWPVALGFALEGFADGSRRRTNSVGGASSVSDDLSELNAAHDSIGLHWHFVSCLGFHAGALL
eukprot:CAMPEP_0172721760 /NCGR_PEP_ID=MMETSP1074-20121228/79813_1 /TAXON_ID=2916 /ORGANISM="Ceratium fusus, Strain PA161109" /LENGTH=88 /DNA_ID=CAMNT_0013547577 /DNA_START=376 /DNA_END=642 /DNA_ORIENTATION=+